MKTYLAGFCILAAAMYFTGCASHPKAAQVRVVIPQKQPSPPARPPLPPTEIARRDSTQKMNLEKLREAQRRRKPAIKVVVVYDTIPGPRDTVYIREIQHKHKRSPCRP